MNSVAYYFDHFRLLNSYVYMKYMDKINEHAHRHARVDHGLDGKYVLFLFFFHFIFEKFFSTI